MLKTTVATQLNQQKELRHEQEKENVKHEQEQEHDEHVKDDEQDYKKNLIFI